jgi:hypothetical protein
MDSMTRKTDRKARLTLPGDFASCLVMIERHGNELHVRKVQRVAARRYSFRELMAGVTTENVHEAVATGPPVGREAL